MQPGERLTFQEMKQKPFLQHTFFTAAPDTSRRPVSVATEFADTDWDDDEIIVTDAEDNSPRVSLQSVSTPIVYVT